MLNRVERQTETGSDGSWPFVVVVLGSQPLMASDFLHILYLRCPHVSPRTCECVCVSVCEGVKRQAKPYK